MEGRRPWAAGDAQAGEDAGVLAKTPPAGGRHGSLVVMSLSAVFFEGGSDEAADEGRIQGQNLTPSAAALPAMPPLSDFGVGVITATLRVLRLDSNKLHRIWPRPNIVRVEGEARPSSASG
jgi:hypothetical protein